MIPSTKIDYIISWYRIKDDKTESINLASFVMPLIKIEFMIRKYIIIIIINDVSSLSISFDERVCMDPLSTRMWMLNDKGLRGKWGVCSATKHGAGNQIFVDFARG